MNGVDDDTLEAYFRLARQQPDLFSNEACGQGPDTIQILMEPADIARAQKEAFGFRSRHGMPNGDVRVGLLAEDPYLTLVRDAVRFPDGSLGLYNRVLEGPSVAAVPILDDKLVLVRIFRHGLRQWSLEFPRGACDAGERAEDAVRRELREEIGADVTELIDMGEFTPGGSILAIRGTLFTARVDGIGQPDRSDAIEKIEVFDVAVVERMIRTGEIIDGWTMSAFLRARVAGLV
jgi:ADP-ribose pyrophosphatase